jgi:hypothetical protein
MNGGRQTEGASEQGAEENIWKEKGGGGGGRRKLHNEEVRDLYYSPSIIRIIKYRLLMEKPEGKRPLGRQRCRWADNIMMDLGEVG